MNMMTDNLPQRVKKLLGDEVPDFVVQAKHAYGWQPIVFPLVSSSGWLIVAAIFFIKSENIASLINWEIAHRAMALITETIRAQSIEVFDSATETDMRAVTLILGIALFLVIELIAMLYRYFKKGGYFVGTPTQLIYTKKGKVESIKWNDLDKDVHVEAKLDRTGTIYLQMNTLMDNLAVISPKRRKQLIHILPTTISMIGIEDVEEIGQLIQRRISHAGESTKNRP